MVKTNKAIDPLEDAGPPGAGLGFLLFRVLRATVMMHHQGAELDALPLAQLRLLWTVFFAPLATMREYSDRLGVSQSTATQLADRLVRRGLVERVQDVSDRRLVRLALDARASIMLTREDEQRQHLIGEVWDRLDERARISAMDSLTRIAEAAEACHEAMGNILPPLMQPPGVNRATSTASEASQQPVLDLMARRVRGTAAGGQ